MAGVDDGTGARRFAGALDGARQGEPAAVAVLFHDLHPRLARFLHAQEPRAADDLHAEVWEAVARGLPAFQGGEPEFRAWVWSIARRRLADHRRRAGRRRTEPTDAAAFAERAGPASTERDALARLSAEEAAALVVALLPEDQAEVVLLRILGDLSTEEVADVMGRPVTWVRVNQHRAVRKLADRLGSRLGVTP
jgi:RNA polymerase sigma-70 factor (ECF subfamily)